MDFSQLPPEQAERAEAIYQQLRQPGDARLRELAALLASKPDHQLLGQTEFEVRDLVHKLGAEAIETAARQRKKGGYQGSSPSCPHCTESARFVSYRARTAVSLLGPVRIERAYYHCRSCGRGHCPWDATLSLSPQATTPAATELASMAGVLDAFALAAERLLSRMAGLRLSESSIQRITEAVGADVGGRPAEGECFGPARPWAWHKDAAGCTCAYVSIDATGVPQQGQGAGSAEGKMATVAMLYNPVPEDRQQWAQPSRRPPPWQARYLASLDGAAVLGQPPRRQAAQLGMDRAERWIALSDGGAGLEDWLRANFGRLDAVILDFYHVSEHLAELAGAWHGVGSEAAKAKHQHWAHRLKHEGGRAVLEELEALVLPRRPALRKLWRQTVGYFRNQVHRMDYPSYRAKGWQIGSGPVEAACKTVVRLKGSGMRWGRRGSDAVCHLRALFLSEAEQWTHYWLQRQAS